MTQLIYKICGRIEWSHAKETGTYKGSQDDMRDGFIHFSTAEQLVGTLAKHFAGQIDLVLVTVDGAALGELLKWERSRGGDLFPHLYGALSVTNALSVQDIQLENDSHVLPDLPELEAI